MKKNTTIMLLNFLTLSPTRYNGILLALFLFSCSEQQNSPPYFEQFQKEANRHGRSVNPPRVILTSNLKDNYHAYWDGKAIYVDTTSRTWKLFPEETMMHEYGHACLNRKHTSERLPNGMYKSVMGNYASPSYAGWTYYDSIQYRKDYYMAELFNPNVNPPEWSR